MSSPRDDDSDSSGGDPFEEYLEYKAAQEKATTAQENADVDAQNKPEISDS